MGYEDTRLALGDLRDALVNAQVPVLQDEVIAKSISANTNIFATDLEALANGFWIIQVTTDTAGYPKVVMTPAGSATSVTAGLNESSDLTVDSWYEFWVAAKEGDKINVQFSTAATVTVRVFFIRSS